MVTISKDKSVKTTSNNSNTKVRAFVKYGLLGIAVLTIGWASQETKKEVISTIESILSEAASEFLPVSEPERQPAAQQRQPKGITAGKAGGVSFYHCSSHSDKDSIPVLLLHGAAFTKEDWKKAPQLLMDKFCGSKEANLSVFAVDLDAQADYNDLLSLLIALEESQQLVKPVSLVTPSMSGNTMISWAAAAATSSMKQDQLYQYIREWVPVACNAVMEAPEEELERLRELPILAIHGNEDVRGKKSSEKLQDLLGAKVLELEGKHPCYLDSPEEFVDAVVGFVMGS